MTNRKRLPIGVENFEELRARGCYYVDKTKFISELVSKIASVSLITRPRRFGKTLTMSMLKEFFDIRKDSRNLFEGLYISEQKTICDEWMNQYPVLFITFKAMDKTTYDKTIQEFSYDIAGLCEEHRYLLESERISEADKERFTRLIKQQGSENELEQGLPTLMRMLYNHYGKKVILLIDEYDVPLAKSNDCGYYNQMTEFIRGVMNRSLKTNPHLKFAVVTGCLRVAKESIFTGVNHLDVNSVYKGSYMDSFGFTDHEVKNILSDMGYEDKYSLIKKWYDGYRFGSYEIYCPWDVINYIESLNDDLDCLPGNYWKSTSHNNIIKRFIGNEEVCVSDKFERLLAGESVETEITEDMTYNFDTSSEENFWSLLYLTGYLTLEKGKSTTGTEWLRIPNEEVKTIFTDTVVEWFKEEIIRKDRSELQRACWDGNDILISEILSNMLFESISFFDYQENTYHALLMGMFLGERYIVKSNRENGLGRSDVVIKDRSKRKAVIFEVKYAKSKSQMDTKCQEAIAQIKDERYKEEIEQEGYKEIICYGITFYKKECKAVLMK